MTGGKLGGNGRLVVVFALLLATAGPALGATAADSGPLGSTNIGVATADSGDSNSPTDAEAVQRESPDENNTTVAHRNPDEVSDEEDLGDVQIWLAREMSGRLAESANLSQADREQARELIGNDSEYAELAKQYQEMKNQQDGNVTGEDSSLRAGQLQRKFFAEVELYRQIHEEYRVARENNETLRKRRLAHELERRIANINRTATRLNESYANLSSMGDAERRNAILTIGEIRSNVTRTQMTVRNQTLVRTQLSVRAADPNGSFTDPVTLVGRLQTADGEPVADENVTLLVGNRTLDATTDGRGRFEVEYRPTLAGVGERPRTVEFRPTNESVYLRDNATAEFDVRQVEPDVTISNRPATIRYNDTLTVNGTVAAEDVGVPDVPVTVMVDGVRVAQVRTDANGSFGAEAQLPANVSNGSREVRVRVVPENATSAALSLRSNRDGGSDQGAERDREVAIASANGSTEVTVESTPTTLTIADVRTFNETAFVGGRLTTESGDALANQTVELRVDGQSVGTATTNATGSYATTVEIPPRFLGGDSSVRVVAAYSPTGGNLAPSEAAGTASFGSSGGVAISEEQLRLGAAGLLAVAVLGAFVWRFRSWGAAQSDSETGPDGGDGAMVSEFTDVRGHSAEALFNSATTAFDDGKPDAASVAAYAAVRQRLGDTDGTNPRTHREFYADQRDAGLAGERLRRLERLTETYERAAFATESVSEGDAREAVVFAESLRPEDEGAKSERPESEYS